MFSFLFKYNAKIILRIRQVLFWTIAFPFMMATIMGFSFKDMDKNTNLDTIPIMTDSAQYEKILSAVEVKGKKVFEIKKYKDYKKALEDKKIAAYIKSEEDKNIDLSKVRLIIAEDSLNASVVYSTVNYISHANLTTGEIMSNKENFGKINQIVADLTKINHDKVKKASNMEKIRPTNVFMYSLMAMICLGSITFGVSIVETYNIKGDFSYASRISVSPISKNKLIMSQTFAYALIGIITSIGLFYYINKVLGIDFGGNDLKIISILILGNIMGILIGIILALILPLKSEAKISVSAAFYVFSSFLAGMMVSTMPGLISNKAPIINYINPATVISRSFSSLYLYKGNEEFMYSLLNNIVYIIILLALVGILSRRRENDSI